jgi:acyl-coenzyme A synthetase/AMP-(fatty) acid ligase
VQREHLRRYEYPHIVAFVDDFPRTATGKIQRYKLREAEMEAGRAERVGSAESRAAGVGSAGSPTCDWP